MDKIVKSGTMVTITVDTGVIEFIATGLRDQASSIAELPVTEFDSVEDQQSYVDMNNATADWLYEFVIG